MFAEDFSLKHRIYFVDNLFSCIHSSYNSDDNIS